MEKFFGMLRDSEFWMGLVVFFVVVGAIVLVGIGFISQDMKEVTFVENGMEQVVLPGSSRPVWQKTTCEGE